MSAADLLRQAIEDAPDGLRVEPEYWGTLAIRDAHDQAWFSALRADQAAILRLIGLLLAAAAHLADLLDADDAQADGCHDGHETANRLAELRAAIEEAAR